MDGKNSMEEFKDEFRVEALEHLEKVEEQLILLEKQIDNPDMNLITSTFRSIHSIKGAAGFLGYTKICDLTHAMETLLQMLRKQEIQTKTGFISILLSGADILRSMLDDLDTSNTVDIRNLVQRISDLIAADSTPETLKKIDKVIHLTDKLSNEIGFDISEFKLENIITDFNKLYLLKYNLLLLHEKEGIKPLTLIKHLIKNGVIIDTRIETKAMDFDVNFSDLPLIFLIVYATNSDIKHIAGRSGIEKDGITEINKDILTLPDVSGPLNTEENQSRLNCFDQLDAENKRESHHHPDTVRIRVDLLDQLMKLAGELVLIRNNLLVMTGPEHAFHHISQGLNIVTTDLQEAIMRTRLQPIGNLFSKLPRIVRDLSMKLDKSIEIKMYGMDVELDKTILESLNDPLVHLIRNCCDHGIEPPDVRRKSGKPATGRIEVHAYHESGQINIRIADDGRGIDPGIILKKAVKAGFKTEKELSLMHTKDILSLIFVPGFSTTESVSDVSGRGVGMDVVKTGIERVGGTVEIESSLDKGTGIHLRLPLTLAIIPCLIVVIGPHRYAIPQVNVKELICLYNEEIDTKIECAGDQEVFRLRDQLLPMVRLKEVLNHTDSFSEETRADIVKKYCEITSETIENGKSESRTLNFAVVKMGSKRYGLIVDEIIGVEEVVVNSMHRALKPLKIYSGTTIMGDGLVALILDIEGIAAHADVRFNIHEDDLTEKTGIDEEIQTVLLFKSGPQEQFAIPLPMIRRIEHLHTSAIEKVGDREFVSIDGSPILILRLEGHLNVSPCVENDEMLLLLPKHIRRPFGILASEVIDTAESSLKLHVKSYMEEGLLGTAMIRERLTLFIDLYRLIELAEPDWFEDQRKNGPSPDQKKRILLAEDTPFFRHLVTGYLEAGGYEVTAAENGKKAAEMIGEKPFDIIVSDLDMPEMDGWTFLEYIRRESHAKDIPAIALTALDSEEDRMRAETAGFNAYQVKLDREALLENVSELLKEEVLS